MAGSGLAARARRVDPAWIGALLAGLGAVAVIRTTLLPSVGPWDTGEAQVVLPVLGTMHPTGFPAYVILGWLTSIILQPLGSPAFLMNLLSALLVGVASGGIVLVARRLGAPVAVGIAVAAGFALTPIVWSIGTAADAHALHLALVVAVVLGLLRWESLVSAGRELPGDPHQSRRADRAIVLAAALFGVALANHALALLMIPPIGLYVLAVEPRILARPRLVLAAAATCLGVAALFYLELPLRAGLFRAPLVYGHPETWDGFWRVVLASQFQGSISGPLADLGAKTGALVDLAGAQFGPLVAVIPVGLAVTIARFPRYALLSASATVFTCFFAASYANAQIDRYYLGPVFFAWTWIAVLAGALVEAVAPHDERRDGVPASSLMRAVPAFALGLVLLAPTILALPVRWHEVDRSHDTSTAVWLNDAFAALAPNAVVVSWWSYSTPLWYGQLVEGRRRDVWVVDDRTRLDDNLGSVEDVIATNLRTRPVYVMRVTESELQDVAAHYVLEPVGLPVNLYRVTGPQETTP